MSSFYDSIASHQYRLEANDQGPTLRLYVEGERKNAFVQVEAGEPDKYLRLNMPKEDKRALRAWMRGKSKNILENL